MKKETPKSPSKFGITFDKAYYMQAKEEYERHFRPDKRGLIKLGFRDIQIQHIEDLYAENFKSEISSKERVARCGKK